MFFKVCREPTMRMPAHHLCLMRMQILQPQQGATLSNP